jgi:hypothetical protein
MGSKSSFSSSANSPTASKTNSSINSAVRHKLENSSAITEMRMYESPVACAGFFNHI